MKISYLYHLDATRSGAIRAATLHPRRPGKGRLRGATHFPIAAWLSHAANVSKTTVAFDRTSLPARPPSCVAGELRPGNRTSQNLNPLFNSVLGEEAIPANRLVVRA